MSLGRISFSAFLFVFFLNGISAQYFQPGPQVETVYSEIDD
jgi:hypothetical protein